MKAKTYIIHDTSAGQYFWVPNDLTMVNDYRFRDDLQVTVFVGRRSAANWLRWVKVREPERRRWLRIEEAVGEKAK